MDMLYRYEETFSLRKVTGICPNIKVKIDMVDKIPFFIKPHHVKEKKKQILDKEMKRLCHMGM